MLFPKRDIFAVCFGLHESVLKKHWYLNRFIVKPRRHLAKNPYCFVHRHHLTYTQDNISVSAKMAMDDNVTDSEV